MRTVPDAILSADFIANAGCALLALNERNERVRLRRALCSFLRLLAYAADRTSPVAFREEREALERYVEMQRLRFPSGPRFEFVCGDGLDELPVERFSVFAALAPRLETLNRAGPKGETPQSETPDSGNSYGSGSARVFFVGLLERLEFEAGNLQDRA